MYKCKYFRLDELVYPEIHKVCEQKGLLDRLWLVFDPNLLRAVDLLRERYGSCTINNWKAGGQFKECGLRQADTSTGALLSAHKFGRAVDCHFATVTSEEIRQEMIKLGCFKPGFKATTDPKLECFRLLGRLEHLQNGKPISWLHVDSYAETDDGSLKLINV